MVRWWDGVWSGEVVMMALRVEESGACGFRESWGVVCGMCGVLRVVWGCGVGGGMAAVKRALCGVWCGVWRFVCVDSHGGGG